MKALQLKTYGKIVIQSNSYIIYNYQELNDRKRYFNYLVELRGIRYCLIRRLNEAEVEQYKSIIIKENENNLKNERLRNQNN